MTPASKVQFKQFGEAFSQLWQAVSHMHVPFTKFVPRGQVVHPAPLQVAQVEPQLRQVLLLKYVPATQLEQ